MMKGVTPRLAEGGKIKIGGLGVTRTSKAGKSYRQPEKHGYFTVTTTERDATGDLVVDTAMMDALAKAGYADADGKIRTLPILLHADDLDEVFPTSYALYHGKQILCRGDGEQADRWEMDKATGTRSQTPRSVGCVCPLLAEGKCKPHGTLHCSIVLPGNAVAGSVHRWRTTSIISIQQVAGSLLQIRQTIGLLRNVPLVLRVREIEVSPGGKVSRVPVCHIELRAADVLSLQRKLLDQAQQRDNLLAAMDGTNRQAYRAMLQAPASDDEPIEERAAIEAEFHPEAQPATEVADGVGKFGKRKAKAETDIAHDPQTGEVIEETKPTQEELGW